MDPLFNYYSLEVQTTNFKTRLQIISVFRGRKRTLKPNQTSCLFFFLSPLPQNLNFQPRRYRYPFGR